MKFVFELYKENLKPKKILFIDRDGVVIKDTGYPHIKKDIIFLYDNINKINKFIKKNDFDACGFVTNQSGVSRGIFNEKTFWTTHNYIVRRCFKLDLKIDFTLVNFFKIPNYFRKPNGGMIVQALKSFAINKNKTIFIGDKESDKMAAKNSGISFIYVKNI